LNEEENNQVFLGVLLDNKIILKIDEDNFKIHPLFQPILQSCLNQEPSIVDGLMNAVHSFTPEISRLEQAVICNFLSDFIKHDYPKLFKELQIELDVFKAEHPDMKITDKNKHLATFDGVMETIDKERKLK
jgi:hypothetical protein